MLDEFAGQVRLVAKDLPLAIHDRARPAAEAARCAGAQGRYWEYRARLFAAQPRFADADLLRYAVEVGLDGEAFARCVRSGTFAAAVARDAAEARALGITGTPTFLVNGLVLVGDHPVENFRAAIAEALRRRAR